VKFESGSTRSHCLENPVWKINVMDLSLAIMGLRVMGWAGHVARMGEGGVHEFCWGNLRERDHMENSRIVGL
jgi:hypothetical protein